jgi:hypothetical protein
MLRNLYFAFGMGEGSPEDDNAETGLAEPPRNPN